MLIGKRNKKQGSKRKASALIALFLVLVPYLVFAGTCFAQTSNLPKNDPAGQQTASQNPWIPQSSNQGGSSQSPAANPPANTTTDPNQTGATQDANASPYQTAPTTPYKSNPPDLSRTTLEQEAAEQKLDKSIMDAIVDGRLTKLNGFGNDVYEGLHQWYADDLFDNLFAGIGQLFGKWLYEFITGWMCDVVRFLAAALSTFVLNPNIANNVANNKDDISMAVQRLQDIMMSIACDLMLILFILAIWRYWAAANWIGMVNPFAPVMRMILAGSLLLAWPTLYSFITQLVNEMIKAIWFNGADQMADFDQALVIIVKAGLVNTASGLIAALAPVMGPAGTGAGLGYWLMGTVGSTVSFAALLIFGILTGVMIAQLMVLLTLKAIQTVVLLAQYVFAPFFLVMVATPDTVRYTYTYINTFCVVNLWTFAWLAMFRLMVIVINSHNAPWGKILLVIGVLQLMLYSPVFLTSAMISPESSILNPETWTKKLTGMFSGDGSIPSSVKTWWSGMQGANTPLPQGTVVPGGAHPGGMNYAGFNGQAPALAMGGPGGPGGNPGNGGAGGAAALAAPAPPGLKGLGVNANANANANAAAGAAGIGVGAAAFNAANPANPGGHQHHAGVAGGAQGFNAADTFGPGLRHRQDLNGFVGGVTDGERHFGHSTDGGFNYAFNKKNNITDIFTPRGASAADVGRSVLVGSAANLISDDDYAKNVAMQGSHAAGYDGPQAGDRARARMEGKTYAQSKIGEYRGQEGAQRYAVEGSNSYFKGEKGNGYTDMLRQRYGDWNADRQAESDSLMTDTSRPDSPWNVSYGAVNDELASLGLKFNNPNKAAAANPWIMSMNRGGKAKSIRAVSSWIQQRPEVASLQGRDRDLAMDHLASGLSANEVDVITDYYVSSNGGQFPEFNEHINAGVQTLMNGGTIRRAGAAHRIMSQYTGGSSSKGRVEAAVNFVQSARNAGLNETSLMSSQIVEVGKMIDNYADTQPEMIPDLAVSAKILGSATNSDWVSTVHSMRVNNWDVNRVNSQQLDAAKSVLASGIAPTQAAVQNWMRQQQRQRP